jgi:hypothetical protein
MIGGGHRDGVSPRRMTSEHETARRVRPNGSRRTGRRTVSTSQQLHVRVYDGSRFVDDDAGDPDLVIGATDATCTFATGHLARSAATLLVSNERRIALRAIARAYSRCENK